jgi:hypothetical protein
MKYFLLFCFVILSLPAISEVEFKEQSFFENKLTMKVPTEFEPMSNELKQIKYPSERRPPLVLTDETSQINLALNWTENKAEQKDLEALKNALIRSLSSVHPKAQWEGEGIIDVNGKKFGYLELVSQAIDTKIYNLMYFTDLEGRFFIMSFNCTEKFISEWKPTAKEIMNSVMVKDE